MMNSSSPCSHAVVVGADDVVAIPSPMMMEDIPVDDSGLTETTVLEEDESTMMMTMMESGQTPLPNHEQDLKRNEKFNTNLSSDDGNVGQKEEQKGDNSNKEKEVVQTNNKKAAPKTSKWKMVREHLHNGAFMGELGTSTGSLIVVDDNNDGSGGSNNDDSSSSDLHDDIRSHMKFTMTHCFVAIALYIILSILCYYFIFEPDWSIIDIVYFAVTTFTTVGYGNIAPTNHASMIFTCFYSIVGILLLGLALGVMGTVLLDEEKEARLLSQQIKQHEVLRVFSSTRNAIDIISDQEVAGDYSSAGTKAEGHIVMRNGVGTTRCASTSCYRLRLALRWIVAAGLLILFVAFIAMLGKWHWIEAFYFLIITASTIGYGDYAPETNLGRILASIFIPISVIVVGHWLGIVANIIVDQRSTSYRRKVFQQRSLTMLDLHKMDWDGDGKVSRSEFIIYMLLVMEKVDQALIDELQHNFEQWDSTGNGELSQHDIFEEARKKLKSPRHKLELAKYKEQLLQQSSMLRQRSQIGGFGGGGGSSIRKTIRTNTTRGGNVTTRTTGRGLLRQLTGYFDGSKEVIDA